MSLNNREAAAQLQIAIHVDWFAITVGPGTIYNVHAIRVFLHLQKKFFLRYTEHIVISASLHNLFYISHPSTDYRCLWNKCV